MAFIRTIPATGEDPELIALYQSRGDNQVLGQLYDRYMEMVYGVCLKYLKEPENAKDAVINIFEELTVKLKKYEITNFRSWLYQLAKNHCLMKLRSNKSDPKISDVEIVQLAENYHPENVMDKEQQLNSLENCIEQLPAEQKESVKLFYLEEKCYKEIAELTGKDINRVRSYIQNGRRNLKICMDKKAMQKA